MTLGELLHVLPPTAPLQHAGRKDAAGLAQPVTAITYDSRRVSSGSVFVALKGQRADGAAFAGQAVARGAVAVVSESQPPSTITIPWFVVDDAREAMAALATAFFGNPSDHMRVVGVTGTNGKTTTCFLISSIFDRAGIPCGRLGTVSYRIGSEERDAARTTPEAPDMQQLLREMVQRGCGACAMEVSSHALALRRVDYTRFAAGVFTNLTRDHLDFHGDMETYFAAKRRLFEMLPDGAVSIINVDDPRGVSLAAMVARPVTYAIDRAADVTCGPLLVHSDGLSFDVRTPKGPVGVRSRLVGRPNVHNILASVATTMALDLPSSAIEKGIAELDSVPGRFQIVSNRGDDVMVVVDYAHTDDALKNVLEAVRPLAAHRLITVFGCGGDRDRSKRPLMGAVAARLSDLVILTSDNPRSEDPDAIVEEIKRGIVTPDSRAITRGRESTAASRTTPWFATVDRRQAIERAIRDARTGDLVLIAGKGHEKYQVVGDRVLPFDDVQVAREALARRKVGTSVS